MNSNFVNTEEALDIIRNGGILILTDDEKRENEGDFVMSAEHATSETVNFMITNGRGLLCISGSEEKINKIGLPMMVEKNTSKLGTPFTVPIDAKVGTTTGISAHERCETIKQFVKDNASIDDFNIPGHLFPLKAVKGGVLKRAGHTEGTTDLARLSGCKSIGLLCEILNEDGTMARMPQLEKIAKKFDLKIATITDLIEYRRRNEQIIEDSVQTNLPTDYGDFTLHLFESIIENQHHLAIVMGDISGDEPVLVRVHSECLTGDALHSIRCDCGMQLDTAMQLIAKEGRGAILYMRQEGRGIGLPAKMHAYHLQDKGADTVEANEKLGYAADLRDYGYGAQMLTALGLTKIKLMTNNPRKIVGLEGYGIEIVERVPIKIEPNPHNKRYLDTKNKKLGHIL